MSRTPSPSMAEAAEEAEEEPTPPPSPTTDFFTRNHLSPATALHLIHAFVATHYPALHPPLPAPAQPPQGSRSYTLCLGDDLVLQFRPAAHKLAPALCAMAREIYGPLAPATHLLGAIQATTSTAAAVPLFVYSLSRVPGLSLRAFRCRPAPSAAHVGRRRGVLVRGFARFLALGWGARRDGRTGLPLRRGRVGAGLRWRVERLRDRLPGRFGPVVEGVLRDLGRIEGLPWVLTHGAVTPDHVMVQGEEDGGDGEEAGGLMGLVDWAESEYLPFGVGLYGAEELFGQSARRWERDGKGRDREVSGRFTYYATTGDLRRLFWEELERAIPPLAMDRRLRATVDQARLLGILLWYGFASDDGRLDRVVEEGRDEEAIQKLDMLLFGTDRPDSTAVTAEHRKQQRLSKAGPLLGSSSRVGNGWSIAQCLRLPGLAFRKG